MDLIPHPHFELQLHTTPDLERLLGEGPLVREQKHQWPLSSVELLTTQTGKRFIYKVQREPTVEPEFLTQAKSALLPACTLLQRGHDQAALLFPFLEAPTLREQEREEQELVAIGRRLVQQIGEIGGEPPVYQDLGTIDAWRAFVAQTLELLSALIHKGAFTQTSPEELEALARWAESHAVLDAIETTSQLIHGDLKAEHVFVGTSGYQIIDWQRPYQGPGEIDLVLLLESQKISPEGHVPPAVIGLRWFLLIHWAAEAKTSLLPNLPFFESWVRQGLEQLHAQWA